MGERNSSKQGKSQQHAQTMHKAGTLNTGATLKAAALAIA